MDGSTSLDGSASIDQAIAACVTLTGCFQPNGGANIGVCMFSLAYYRPSEIHCLAAAGANCDQAGRCISGQVEQRGMQPPCTAGNGAWICDGAELVECENGVTFRVSCPAVYAAGTSCMMPQPGCRDPLMDGDCALGPCTGSAPSCNGTVATSCYAGVQEAVDCALQRPPQVCHFDGTNASCGGTGPPCTGSSRCDGDTLVDCDGGFEARVDCSVIEGSCQSASGISLYAYCGYGTACDPGQFGTCNGTQLTFCAGGLMRTVDCRSFGFSTCSGGLCAL
jgi:hypothetical protein